MSWLDKRRIKLNSRHGNGLMVSWLLMVSSSFTAAAQSPSSTLLTGSILANPDVRFGSPSTNTANQWILLPLWLGGTWETKSEILLNVYDYRQGRYTREEPVSIKIYRVSVLGTQQDKRGQIWHYIGTPFQRTIKAASFSEVQHIESLSLVKTNPGEVSVSCVATITRTDKEGRELLSPFKERTITTYAPIKDGLIRVTFITNDFDAQNRPTVSSTETCTEQRTEVFHQVDRDERGELQSKFREFLMENGLRDLLDH